MKTDEQNSVSLKSFTAYTHIRRHVPNEIGNVLAYCHTIINLPSFEADPSYSDDRPI